MNFIFDNYFNNYLRNLFYNHSHNFLKKGFYLLEYLIVGGFFMWPIFALMVLSLGIILEKIYQLYLIQNSINNDYKTELKDAIYTKDISKIKSFCLKNRNSISKSLLKAIEVSDKEDLDLAYENIMQNKLNELTRGEFLLGIAISICPQLGLLGTVTGMISAFTGLSNESNEAMVAAGISEALFTTAYGLSVAVFALFFHILFNKRIDYINNEIYFYLSLFKKVCK